MSLTKHDPNSFTKSDTEPSAWQRRPLAALIGAALSGFGLALLCFVLFASGPTWGLLLAILILLLGIGLIVLGVRSVQTIAAPPSLESALLPDAEREIVQPEPVVATAAPLYEPPQPAAAPAVIVQHQPRIVAIGGGTGMPQLLRGLRGFTDDITAIVTVADDGGSSGRLRRQMGVLPPGDFRNNIAALSQAEELLTRLFQYRFADSDVGGNSSELAGHSFGNLFITTMAAVTGSFEAGLAESSRVLAVRGRVLPSTLEHLTLCAEMCFTQPDGSEAWRVIEGESNITHANGQIMRVFLKPDHPRAYPAVIRAILQADLIVAGPGSFFTSVMPNLLVPAIRDAICAAQAPRIYLCNVATQQGETDGYGVADHMRQLRYHAGEAFPAVLANHRYDLATPPSSNAQWVFLPSPEARHDFQLFTGDVVDRTHPWRHDSQKLAARVMEIYQSLSGKRKSA